MNDLNVVKDITVSEYENTGSIGKLLSIRYPCSRCVPAYLVGNKITFDLSEFSFPNAK